MRIRQLHEWDLSVEEAIETQRRLADRIRVPAPSKRKIRRIAAGDISYDRGSDRIWAAIVVFSYPEIEQLEIALHTCRVHFPYIPGLLSFREAPPLLDGLAQLVTQPDVLLLDAHGLAHPRRFGLACHIGLLASLPSIGCAKSLLVGEHARLGSRRGSTTPIYYNRRKIGIALRTRNRVRPVYVSCGYKMRLSEALAIIHTCTGPFRIPTPLRAAHNLANRARKMGSIHIEKVTSGLIT